MTDRVSFIFTDYDHSSGGLQTVVLLICKSISQLELICER